FPVFYKGKNIGIFYADLVIEKKIIVELKAVNVLKELMEAQTINYLKISNITIGYLINFNSTSAFALFYLQDPFYWLQSQKIINPFVLTLKVSGREACWIPIPQKKRAESISMNG
ncbi:MAG: GxxExxY protein, partial [Spirochaetales bacterium]|nr:GxxExxY protein [Spirochaetales bacterium]